MTVVAVGSRWQRRWTQTVFAKVVHVIEHKLEGADDVTRWVIYEEIHEYRGRKKTGGMAIMDRSRFLDMFTHPPRNVDPEVP